ncbi:MAG: hypothetical protein DRI46_11620 [Chloroflexi bacterium]|nr:MAG: hypothetical protein DRI46_11620 [Chloroflexota bacterium]
MDEQRNQELQDKTAGMDSKRLEEFKTAFVFGYNFLSEGDNFKTLVKHATENNPAEALSVYIVNLTNVIIEEYGFTDAEILFYTATSLLSDAVDRLREKGVEVSDQDLEIAISKGIEGVLLQNPEVAQDASQNPNLAKHIPDEVKQGAQKQLPEEGLLLDAQQAQGVPVEQQQQVPQGEPEMPPELAQEINQNG